MQPHASESAHPPSSVIPVAPLVGTSGERRREGLWGWLAPLQPLRFTNLAGWDRVLRVVVGVVLLVAGWAMDLSEIETLALRLFGWVPVLTGLLGWSPLYSLLEITTRPADLQDR
jgi:hypothetical protein